MADPFVAEIRIFPFNFPPTGWAWCDGQLMPISQNTALFSLLGTVYGGDGKSNFALPDLRGSAPMHPGQGTGLSLHDLGETGGSETATLVEAEMPAHTHFLRAAQEAGEENDPANAALGVTIGNNVYNNQGPAPAGMAPEFIAPVGGGQPHNNMMPFLALYFCIALQGVYPPRP